MKSSSKLNAEALWQQHNLLWRNPAEVISGCSKASEVDTRLLKFVVKGRWWETLAECDVTLLITREYEHLLIALTVKDGRPHLSYLPVPHPSGLAFDRKRRRVYLASTRNPNQIFELAPVSRLMPRADVKVSDLKERYLVPVRLRFYPGSLYIHDLAMIKDSLYANAVGQNRVVRLLDEGSFKAEWWPRCVESPRGPLFDKNLIQLNSIAAGKSLSDSYFTASTDRISGRRPGHRNFPVDGRGVVFSGRTRESIVRGLTRPHSARFLKRELWVGNSGYGELVKIERGEIVPVVRLQGWTRGLCFKDRIAFVGTSRVIPRFRQYAPGLDVDRSVCAVHAVDTETGNVMGSILWPAGNQIFAIEWLPKGMATSLPFLIGKRRSASFERLLFYAYQIDA